MRCRLLSLIVVCVPAVVSTLAHAAGSYVGDIEAASIGQAGANIASPSTLGAFWYNPAALATQGGLRLQAEGGFQYTPLSYQRPTNERTGEDYELVRNTTPFKPAAFGAVTYDFGVKDLAVGVAVYSPTSGRYVYSDAGAQRYDNISADNTVIHSHLGVAYRPFAWLSLGVTFGNTYFKTVQRVAVSGVVTDPRTGMLLADPEAAAWAVPLHLNVSDPFTITSNFGVRFEPLDQLAIGISVMPPYDIQATGRAGVELPPVLQALASVNGDQVELAMRMPMIARAGIRYRPLQMLSIEAAFVWEQWSRNNTITVTPVDVRVSAPLAMIDNQQIPQIALNKSYKDTYAARLGLELTPLQLLTVRAGGLFESSAVRKERFDISTPDTNKFGIAVGASLNVWKLSFDAAYMAIIAPPVNVTASQKELVSVLPNLSGPVTIGNGRYEFGYHMVHFGVRASLFDSPKPVASSPAVDASPDAPSTIPSP